jgi:hypothetical protein
MSLYFVEIKIQGLQFLINEMSFWYCAMLLISFYWNDDYFVKINMPVATYGHFPSPSKEKNLVINTLLYFRSLNLFYYFYFK